jgi:EmrB/QacA subfamily drug resistance transporter
MLPIEKTNKWLVLAIMCLLTVMLNIDATAVNLAIPVISHQFHAQLSTMQWVLNLFLLAAAMLQIIGGRLGDVLGHAKIFNYGTLLFVVASAMCGFSHGPALLLTGRLLQGIALGLAYPMTLAIVFRIFPKSQYGTAMGVIMGIMGISLAIGPTIGGAFVEYSTWNWIFFINIPIGLLSLFLSWRYCPIDKVAGQLKDIDYRGAAVLILGLLGIILSLNQVQNWGFDSGAFIGIFVAGIFFIALLAWLEKRTKNPIMNFSLFKIKDFSLYNIIRIMSQVVFLPLLFFIPLFLVNIVLMTPLTAGVVMLAMTIVVGVSSPIAGRWVDKSGPKVPTLVSFVFMAVGCYLFTLLHPEPQMSLLTIGLILNGIGCGISFTSTTTGGLSPVPQEQAGVATGVYFTVIWTSCAFAVAISGTILAFVSKSALAMHLLQHAGTSFSSSQVDLLTRTSRGLVPVSALSHFFLPQHLATVMAGVKNAFIAGFHGLNWALVIVAIIGFVATLPTTNRIVPAQDDALDI